MRCCRVYLSFSTYDFINNLGQSVLSLKHLNLSTSINVSSIAKGIYMIKCTDLSGQTKVEKIVIE